MPLPLFLLPAVQQGLSSSKGLPAPVRLGLVGGALSELGKRKRSACRLVSDADRDAFLTPGGAAPWIITDRIADLHAATGGEFARSIAGRVGSSTGTEYDAEVWRTVAGLHLESFVPLCRQLEGDNLTADPASGQGAETYATARARWQEQIRSGRILDGLRHAPRGGSGGDAGPAGRGDSILPAGLAGSGALAVGAALLVALFFFSRR